MTIEQAKQIISEADVSTVEKRDLYVKALHLLSGLFTTEN